MKAFFAGDFDKVSEIYLVSVPNAERKDGWEKVADLLAQIRAASSASDESCSYSFDTICTHSGNSSTLARLRPKSKMRILGSGTPRLKRDLGYG